MIAIPVLLRFVYLRLNYLQYPTHLFHVKGFLETERQEQTRALGNEVYAYGRKMLSISMVSQRCDETSWELYLKRLEDVAETSTKEVRPPLDGTAASLSNFDDARH